MNKEIMRVGQTYVAKSDSGAMRKDAGAALVKTGVGAGGLYLAAGLIPFVNFPVLLVLAVLLGFFLYAKD